MKNILLFTAILFASIFLSSCFRCKSGQGDIITKELSLTDLNSLELEGSFNLHVSQGDVQSITATGHENVVDALETKVSNGHWGVGFGKKCFKNFQLDVYVTIPTLTYVGLSGSGDVKVNSFTGLSSLSIAHSGSGSIKFNDKAYVAGNVNYSHSGSGDDNVSVEASSVDLNKSGSGDIQLQGESGSFKIKSSGSGNVNAYSFVADKVTVSISGSGNSKVSALSSLDVKISGSGDVSYKGSPSVSSNVSGSGKVKNAN